MVQDPCTLNTERRSSESLALSATLPGVTTGRNPTSTKHTLKKRRTVYVSSQINGRLFVPISVFEW